MPDILGRRLGNAQDNITDLREAREVVVTSAPASESNVTSAVKIPSRASQRAEAEQAYAQSLNLEETSEY